MWSLIRGNRRITLRRLLKGEEYSWGIHPYFNVHSLWYEYRPTSSNQVKQLIKVLNTRQPMSYKRGKRKLNDVTSSNDVKSLSNNAMEKDIEEGGREHEKTFKVTFR